MTNNRPASSRTVSAAERRLRVVQLRQARLSFVEIGRQLDITGQRAGQLYKEALAQIPRMAVEEHRVEELELIDLATRRLMAIAIAATTDQKTKVAAWAVICKWAEQKAKLLGLNAPSRHEVITIDAIDAEIAQLETALAGGAQAPPAPSAP